MEASQCQFWRGTLSPIRIDVPVRCHANDASRDNLPELRPITTNGMPQTSYFISARNTLEGRFFKIPP
ncbi:hypothetical protein TNCV_2569741 [Trichonephila clavipes]|nr:hypothetical protein TNCV_2569741 [Trichonephila clavipes]